VIAARLIALGGPPGRERRRRVGKGPGGPDLGAGGGNGGLGEGSIRGALPSDAERAFEGQGGRQGWLVGDLTIGAGADGSEREERGGEENFRGCAAHGTWGQPPMQVHYFYFL
jgi:hypothetical protein